MCLCIILELSHILNILLTFHVVFLDLPVVTLPPLCLLNGRLLCCLLHYFGFVNKAPPEKSMATDHAKHKQYEDQE